MPSEVNGNPGIFSGGTPGLKPIYLFADSRLLFHRRADASSFLDDVVQNTGVTHPSVAYLAHRTATIQASITICLPAFEASHAGERKMVPSRPTTEERLFLESAEIILLAGGSVEVGWRAFEENGFRSLIRQRYFAGAILLGVSAGAAQVGRGGLRMTSPLSYLHLASCHCMWACMKSGRIGSRNGALFPFKSSRCMRLEFLPEVG